MTNVLQLLDSLLGQVAELQAQLAAAHQELVELRQLKEGQ